MQRLTSPKHHVDKTYVVTLDAEPGDELISAFTRGVELKEGGERETTLPATLRLLGDRRAEVTVREGRYHQVRRMFAAYGLHVVALHRTRFGEWELGDLPEGHWHELPLPLPVGRGSG